MFTSPDGGVTWEVLGADLPQVPVLDLDLHHGTPSLPAGTFLARLETGASAATLRWQRTR